MVRLAIHNDAVFGPYNFPTTASLKPRGTPLPNESFTASTSQFQAGNPMGGGVSLLPQPKIFSSQWIRDPGGGGRHLANFFLEFWVRWF